MRRLATTPVNRNASSERHAQGDRSQSNRAEQIVIEAKDIFSTIYEIKIQGVASNGEEEPESRMA
jgi:hypothetical protein